METSLQIFISTVLNVLWNTCFKVLMKSVEYFKTVDGYKKRQFYLFIFFLVSLKVKYCAVLMPVLKVFPLTAVPGPYFFWCSSHGPSLFNSLSTIFIFSHHSPSLWAFLVATIWSVTACQPFNALALLSVWDHGTACCAVVFWSSNANMQFKAPYKHQ